MISDRAHNLFQFIDFMHSNIENFRGYQQNIEELRKATYEKFRYELYCIDNDKIIELQKITEAKYNVLYDSIYRLIDNKSVELNIYDPEHLHIECFNFDLHQRLEYEFHSTLFYLKRDVDKKDIPIVMKAKQQYIELRHESTINDLYATFFEKLDEIMAPVLKDFWEEGDKSIPKIKINLLSREQIVKSIVEIDIKPNQVNKLFNFIEFLHSNISYLKKHDNIVDEYVQLRIKRVGLPPAENYKERLEQQKIEKKIESIKTEIHANITNPIITRAENLGIYNPSESLSIWDLNMPAISELKQNFSLENTKIIQQYEQKYVEFREATKYREYDCFLIFDALDDVLVNMFSFFSESGISELELSKNKYRESIRLSNSDNLQSVSKKTHSKTETVTDTPNVDNTKKTPQIKTLYSFIDFLHANIENFNQYDNVILELMKLRERLSQLGFHFTETIERRALEKEIHEKWNVIFKNIVNPIKDKIAELELFDWSAQEMLSNNYFHIANTLSKTYDEKDLDTILKAKTQYIEFTNKISPRVIKQAERMFEYLYDVMYEIAKNFEEEGDKPIKHEEVRRVETFEELVEGFKAGEKISMPLLPSNLPQGGVKKEANPESYNINNGIENMKEQEIFNRIKILTEEVSVIDGFMYDSMGSRLSSENDVVTDVYSDLYDNLDKSFKLLYFRGKVDLLQRIKTLLCYEQKKLKGIKDWTKILLETTLENDNKKDIDKYESEIFIYKTIIRYVKQLIDLINSFTTTNTQNEQEEIEELNDKIRPLFKFIEYLDSNIENFRHYDIDILKMEEAQKKESYLGGHFDDIEEKKRLQKISNEIYERISEHVLEPLKSKVNELGVYTWNNPAQIYNLYIEDVNVLINKIKHNKISKDRIDVIKEVKRQYIIIRNKFKQYTEHKDSYLFVKYTLSLPLFFEDVMKPITSFFFEDGDEMKPGVDNISDKQPHDIPEKHNTSKRDEQKRQQPLYTPKPFKYTSKHYVLAFIFDCLATEEDYTLLYGEKYQLETIGEKRVNGAISGNTFYKAFNKLANNSIDFDNKRDLIYFAGKNWREIIIKLSHEPEKVSGYLTKRGL